VPNRAFLAEARAFLPVPKPPGERWPVVWPGLRPEGVWCLGTTIWWCADHLFANSAIYSESFLSAGRAIHLCMVNGAENILYSFSGRHGLKIENHCS
jgi:hypothetical protein